MIAHPPCTHLSVSGARWFPEKRKDGRQQAAIDFFMEFVNCDCPMVAIENPIGIMSTVYRKPDQIIQPWQFGHGETKATCLWLKGLPPLIPTDIVEGRDQRIWRMGPSPDRAKLRSKGKAKLARQTTLRGVYVTCEIIDDVVSFTVAGVNGGANTAEEAVEDIDNLIGELEEVKMALTAGVY